MPLALILPRGDQLCVCCSHYLIGPQPYSVIETVASPVVVRGKYQRDIIKASKNKAKTIKREEKTKQSKIKKKAHEKIPGKIGINRMQR